MAPLEIIGHGNTLNQRFEHTEGFGERIFFIGKM
jgi:hypothetical protein